MALRNAFENVSTEAKQDSILGKMDPFDATPVEGVVAVAPTGATELDATALAGRGLVVLTNNGTEDIVWGHNSTDVAAGTGAVLKPGAYVGVPVASAIGFWAQSTSGTQNVAVKQYGDA